MTACKTNYHFLNYWQVDGAVHNNHIRQRNDTEKIRHYLIVRAEAFFHELFHDQEMLDQNIDATHFVTETLYKLWELAFNNGNPNQRNPALKAVYATEQEAIQYEDFMKVHIFDHITTNYIQLKKQFQEAIQSNNHMSVIFKIQNHQSQFLPTPLVSFQTVLSKMADLRFS